MFAHPQPLTAQSSAVCWGNTRMSSRESSSPISTLPVELVLEIIHLAAEDTNSPPGAIPIVLSHVCTLWRAIALGEARFWSTISISNMYAPHGLHSQLARASVFAARSKTRRLRLFILVRSLSPLPCGAQDAARAIAEFLALCAPRLREFSLQYTQAFHSSDVALMLPQTRTPRLQSCVVECVVAADFHPFPAYEPAVVPWLQSGGPTTNAFTALQHLVLSAATLEWSQFAPKNLRSLELSDLPPASLPTWAELHAVLQMNAHTLTQLTLDGVLPLSHCAHPPITLPALVSLCIRYTTPYGLGSFAETVRVPALHTLALKDHVGAGANLVQLVAYIIIMHRMPMHRIHTLCLSGPIFRALHGAPSVRAASPMPRVFFARLLNLHTLNLTHPDKYTLRALNHVSLRCVPLARLELVGVRRGAVEAFLAQRVRHGMPQLKELWVAPENGGTVMGSARRILGGVMCEEEGQ